MKVETAINRAKGAYGLHCRHARGPLVMHKRLKLVRLLALTFSVFAAGCFGPGLPYYNYGGYNYGGYAYTPPVYDYRGYGRPVVVENRSAFGDYRRGGDVWADSERGRASYARHEEVRRPVVHQPQASAQAHRGAQVGHSGGGGHANEAHDRGR